MATKDTVKISFEVSPHEAHQMKHWLGKQWVSMWPSGTIAKAMHTLYIALDKELERRIEEQVHG